MEPPTARAFCPGHASGIFSVKTQRGQDEAKGSTGAGVCLSLGALAEVTLSDGDGAVTVEPVDAPGGPPDELPVAATAARTLLGEAYDKDVRVRTQLQLPLGQGLGMSGAAALSTTMALAGLLEEGRYEAVRAAHLAELHHLTGLGDVAAQIHGGIVLRRAPGIPPYGSASSIPGDLDLVLAVLGDGVDNPSVLGDAGRMQEVSALGDQALAHLLKRPSPERFFTVSRAFAEQAGFVPDGAAKVLEALDRHGQATVALIGNAVLAAGDADAMVRSLPEHVDVYRPDISERGARRVQT